MNPNWYEIDGNLVFPPGSPTDAVTSALVSVTQSSVPLPETALRTNPDGTFCMFLPEGEFTVDARSCDGQLTGEAHLVVNSDTSVSIILKVKSP